MIDRGIIAAIQYTQWHIFSEEKFQHTWLLRKVQLFCYITTYFLFWLQTFILVCNITKTQASCERRSNCADSATYEVTDPDPEP